MHLKLLERAAFVHRLGAGMAYDGSDPWNE